MSRIIRVTGIGKIKVKADMQSITFSCDEVSKTYEDSLVLFEKKNKQARDTITKIGFDVSKLLLTDFDISQEYEYFDEMVDNKKYSKHEIVGYKLSMTYKYEMEVDTQKLGRLLYCIKGYFDLNNNTNTSVKIGYFVKDEEKCKKEAIKNAINDCKEKGQLLAEVSSVTLGDILNISYSWNRFEVYDNTSYSMRNIYKCDYDYEITSRSHDSFNAETELSTNHISFQAEADMIFKIK